MGFAYQFAIIILKDGFIVIESTSLLSLIQTTTFVESGNFSGVMHL